jgi:hypothetical protein
MTLAPGWRWMFRMMAGLVPDQPASFTFSAPATTLATFLSRIGAPLL